MNAIVQSKLAELTGLCRKHHARRLVLFGSAAAGRFDKRTSDLDLLVEYEAMPPTQHADHYFGLLEDLEKLFGLPIDLIELQPIRNPYFRRSVEHTQVVLYEAA
jgi:predicted nucleotidyltransferase